MALSDLSLALLFSPEIVLTLAVFAVFSADLALPRAQAGTPLAMASIIVRPNPS